MSSSAAVRRPLLIVVSAPSGAGKTTLCNRLTEARADIVRSVSCTTRSPRGAERNGRDYHFLSEAEFDRCLAEGAFLEHACVHGHRYGTLRKTVEAAMRAGRSVVLAIDVQGAAQIRAHVAAMPQSNPVRQGHMDVFVEPPSLEALRTRLTGRGEDPAHVIEQRMRNAEAEMAERGAFRYRLVNDDLDRASRELVALVDREAGQARG
jgi:guanylate kinase